MSSFISYILSFFFCLLLLPWLKVQQANVSDLERINVLWVDRLFTTNSVLHFLIIIHCFTDLSLLSRSKLASHTRWIISLIFSIPDRYFSSSSSNSISRVGSSGSSGPSIKELINRSYKAYTFLWLHIRWIHCVVLHYIQNIFLDRRNQSPQILLHSIIFIKQ